MHRKNISWKCNLEVKSVAKDFGQIQVAWNNQFNGFFMGQLYTHTQKIWMLNSEYCNLNFYAYHNLHFISATLLTGYILAVYTLRGKTKQVPPSIWNKTLSDCKKGNTPVKLILLHRKQFTTKHLIPLAITGYKMV